MADFIKNHPITKGEPLRNGLFKLAGVAYPHGGIALERLLSWDFDKLIIAHGICLEKDAKPFAERAFRWLMR
jgi:hypothetical protein